MTNINLDETIQDRIDSLMRTLDQHVIVSNGVARAIAPIVPQCQRINGTPLP